MRWEGTRKISSLSVLALRCFHWVSKGKSKVSHYELFGFGSEDKFVTLPSTSNLFWQPRKSSEQITHDTYNKWQQEMIKESNYFVLNADHAPSFDSCALVSPPIFVQDKQSLTARLREVSSKSSAQIKLKWKTVEDEIMKCPCLQLPDKPEIIFLFCSDTKIDRQPEDDATLLLSKFPNVNVLLVEPENHSAFFGPVIATIRSMTFSEVSAPRL